MGCPEIITQRNKTVHPVLTLGRLPRGDRWFVELFSNNIGKGMGCLNCGVPDNRGLPDNRVRPEFLSAWQSN